MHHGLQCLPTRGVTPYWKAKCTVKQQLHQRAQYGSSWERSDVKDACWQHVRALKIVWSLSRNLQCACLEQSSGNQIRLRVAHTVLDFSRRDGSHGLQVG